MKNQTKKLTLSVLLAGVFAFSFLFTGCSFVDSINNFLSGSNSGADNGGDGNGNGEEKNPDDGNKDNDKDKDQDQDRHTHSLRSYAASSSTCTKRGNRAYWYCTGCGQYFLSAAAENAVSSGECFLPYASHNYVDSVCTSCGDVQFEEGNLTEVSAGAYGYSTLTPDERLFYDSIAERAREFHTDGEALTEEDSSDNLHYILCRDASASGNERYFVYSDFGLTSAEAGRVYRVFRADHPLYYWLTSSFLVSPEVYGKGSIMPVVQKEYASANARRATNSRLNAQIRSFREKADGHDDSYHKALSYHDAIIDAIDYSYSSPGVAESANWAHSILGVFLQGETCGSVPISGAVCEGYAKAFQLLLNLSGIPNVYVTGFGYTGPSTGENHAWNLAEIGGKYYGFDLTWDDQPLNPGSRIYHYFCASEENADFTNTHRANVVNRDGLLYEDVLYALPDSATAETEYAGAGILDTVYQSVSDQMKFSVCGYNELRLEDCGGTGGVEIPESISFDGREYKVSIIGKLEGNTLKVVFAEGITEVAVPKTVRYIYGVAFRTKSLAGISVDPDNEKYTSDGGVLYTKSKYALVSYPVSHPASGLILPAATKLIMCNAFSHAGLANRSLRTLTVNGTTYYLKTHSVGYIDSKAVYDAYSVGDGLWGYAYSSAALQEDSRIETIRKNT